ncbi:hypothetical protein FPV67DRAFT_1675222 [Lyophyllum atratum]|nr:hypothetical protein FPV67DRAFT_1675222 [Lyophyllum atratum]
MSYLHLSTNTTAPSFPSTRWLLSPNITLDTVIILLSNRAISRNRIHPRPRDHTPQLTRPRGYPQSTIGAGHRATSPRPSKIRIPSSAPLPLLRPLPTGSHTRPGPPIPPRVPGIGFVDLFYLDEGFRHALLHKAAGRKDLRLIELAGSAGTNERVKASLRQLVNHGTTLVDSKAHSNKHTSLAKGHSPVYIVSRPREQDFPMYVPPFLPPPPPPLTIHATPTKKAKPSSPRPRTACALRRTLRLIRRPEVVYEEAPHHLSRLRGAGEGAQEMWGVQAELGE